MKNAEYDILVRYMYRRVLSVIRDGLLGWCGWLLFQVRGSQRSVVLAYHSISEADWIHAVSPALFSEHLDVLQTHADVVSLEDIEDRHSHPIRSRRPVVAITFDDGYEDWVQVAGPLLKKKDLPATFFTTSSLRIITSEPHAGLQAINAKGVKSLSDMGFEIGSHGHTHTPFPECSEIQLLEECGESQRILSEITGRKIVRLSYPKNRPHPSAVPILEKKNYVAAYDGHGAVHPSSERWDIPRLTITRDISCRRLRWKIYATLIF